MRVNVYHEEEGIIFRKIEGESGISYLTVPLEEVDVSQHGLLVRHGNPQTGNCGYYPLNLLDATAERRWHAAMRSNKRPPTEEWVAKTKAALKEAGITFH